MADRLLVIINIMGAVSLFAAASTFAVDLLVRLIYYIYLVCGVPQDPCRADIIRALHRGPDHAYQKLPFVVPSLR